MLARMTVRSCENVRALHLRKATLPGMSQCLIIVTFYQVNYEVTLSQVKHRQFLLQIALSSKLR